MSWEGVGTLKMNKKYEYIKHDIGITDWLHPLLTCLGSLYELHFCGSTWPHLLSRLIITS